MSCCDGWYNYPKNYRENNIEIASCPECGEDVDEDGDAMSGCYYSPVVCKTCGSAPCDLSC
jgi:hypothetical protein